jgi:hypothetical protein
MMTSSPRERLSFAVPLLPKPVCRNARDQNRDSYQSILRKMKDRIDRHQPTDGDEEDRRKRMAWNSVCSRRFTFTKDEDTARSQSEEDHID